MSSRRSEASVGIYSVSRVAEHATGIVDPDTSSLRSLVRDDRNLGGELRSLLRDDRIVGGALRSLLRDDRRAAVV